MALGEPRYDDDGWETTAPVGSYPAGQSPFGLADMAGNVWEWTSTVATGDDPVQRAGEARMLRGGGFSINNPVSANPPAASR